MYPHFRPVKVHPFVKPVQLEWGYRFPSQMDAVTAISERLLFGSLLIAPPAPYVPTLSLGSPAIQHSLVMCCNVQLNSAGQEAPLPCRTELPPNGRSRRRLPVGAPGFDTLRAGPGASAMPPPKTASAGRRPPSVSMLNGTGFAASTVQSHISPYLICNQRNSLAGALMRAVTGAGRAACLT